jgi:hypothetical protein
MACDHWAKLVGLGQVVKHIVQPDRSPPARGLPLLSSNEKRVFGSAITGEALNCQTIAF